MRDHPPSPCIPGPRGWLSGLPLVRARRRMFAYLRQLTDRYGDIVQCRVGRRRMIVLNHPDLIHDVLVQHHADFAKGYALDRLKLVFGEGLITSNGEFHRQQRRAIQPAFDREHLEQYHSQMAARTAECCAGWDAGRPRDVYADMLLLAVRLLGESLLGGALGDDTEPLLRAIVEGNETFGRWGFLPAAQRVMQLPLPAVRRFRGMIAKVDELAFALLDHRRDHPEQRDLLSVLLAARDDAGRAMSKRQLRDELVSILLAGFETTALGLTWALGLLAQHPDIDAQLHDEVERALGGEPLTSAYLPQIDLCRRVLAESLRLFPPVPVLGRRALRDVELGGYRIPRGHHVVLPQWLLHRDPRFWSEPERFQPDHWLPDQQRPKFAYFPFGGGPRVCIGEPLFWLEAPLMLATIVQHWRFELAPGATLDPVPQLTLRPRGGMWLVPMRRPMTSASRRMKESCANG